MNSLPTDSPVASLALSVLLVKSGKTERAGLDGMDAGNAKPDRRRSKDWAKLAKRRLLAGLHCEKSLFFQRQNSCAR